MLHDEYLNATMGLEVFVPDVTPLAMDTDIKLIDVVLDNRDKACFDELVGQINKNT